MKTNKHVSIKLENTKTTDSRMFPGKGNASHLSVQGYPSVFKVKALK
jgi:hypothetical protein